MKVLYTKNFKEKLSQPWSNISLGKVKLREGTNTGLTKQNTEKIMEFPDSFFKFATRETYNSEIIELPEGGIQIFLDIPDENQSFYDESFRYQVLMFFYTDLLTDTESLAFVCYENIEYSTEDKVKFTGLKLTSQKNIITFPNLTWSGNINFSQSEVIKFLESKEGNLDINPYLSGIGFTSKDSWKAWVIDSISERTLTPWIETTYINNYGIKVY